MTDKLYAVLHKPKYLRLKQVRTEAELDGVRLSVLPSGISYDRDNIQTSPVDPMPIYLEQVEALLEKLRKIKQERADAISDVIDLADDLDDNEGTIIVLRFISEKSFPDIASDMHRSDRQIYRDYRRAISLLEKKI